jgi:PAS domain S-box-containing protein
MQLSRFITHAFNSLRRLFSRSSEQALRESEERLQLISSVTSDYTFTSRFDGHGGLQHDVYGGAFETITGYTPEEFVKIGGWASIVHPDDRAQDAHDMAMLGENKSVITEVRIIRKDGQIRWVRVYGYPLWDSTHKNLVGIYGAVQDINQRKLAEQALKESEERFRLISAITSDYTFSSRFDNEGKLVTKVLTGAFSTITGYTPDEFVKMGGWRAILHPDDQAQNELDFTALKNNQSITTEARIIKKNGEFRWVRVYGYAVWDEVTKQLTGVDGAVQDIDQRKLAELALQESEKRYRVISEIISDYAYAYDIHPDGSYSCNWITEDSFKRLTGYTWSETGTSFTLYHPDDAPIVQKHVKQTVAGQATSGDYRIITKSGETRWIHIQRQVEWDENQKRFVRFYGAAQDITERKQAESALANDRKLLRAVIDHLPNNIFVKDREGRFLVNSPESMRILGVSSQEEVLGKTDFDFLPHDNSQKWYESQQKIMRSGKPVLNLEIFQPWRTDKRRWLLFTTVPLYDEHGQVTGLLGIDHDISEQKKSENAIREKEAFLRALLDATPDIAFLMSVDGRFLTVNKPLAESLNSDTETLLGKNGFELLTDDLREERYRQFKVCVETRLPVRWVDGRLMGWWDNSFYPILSESGEVEAVAVYSKNITEEKRLAAELQRYTTQLEQMVEERTVELRRAKEQIEIILNNTRDAIALARADGDIETRNPAFISMFGEQVSNWTELLLWTVATEEQTTAVGKALLNTIQNQEGQRVELQIVSETAGNKDIDMAFIPVQLTNNQERSGILVSAHDITHIKQIERFKTRFIDDAMHDLATPIAGLTNRLYLMKRSPEKLDEHLHKLENQVSHLRNLLDDLRSLSQLDRGQLALQLEPYDINQIVGRVFDTYEPVAISKGQNLNLFTTPNLPAIQVDARQMERVFVNLVANAINYTLNDKAIWVRTAVDDDNIIFSVSDEGIGISPDDLPHVFDRFYRTAGARSTQSTGTGLGLAIVKEIVERHGGGVKAESELGKGSAFTVNLPIRR